MENSPLCRLPIELRNTIVEYSLYQERPIDVACVGGKWKGKWMTERSNSQQKAFTSWTRDLVTRVLVRIDRRKNKQSPLALLFVCKQLYEDYALLFYSINTFRLHCIPHGVHATTHHFTKSVGNMNASAIRHVIAVRYSGTYDVQVGRRIHVASCVDEFCIGYCATLCEGPASMAHSVGAHPDNSFEVETRMRLWANRKKAVVWVRIQLIGSWEHLRFQYKEVRILTPGGTRPTVAMLDFVHEVQRMVRVWCGTYSYCQTCCGLFKNAAGLHRCPEARNLQKRLDQLKLL